MHRHGYKGRKLQLAAGPRRALLRGQLTSLVLHEQITTTEAKAREVAPRFERLVTKAKKGDLHNRRQIRAEVMTDKATQKLIEQIAPAFKDRQGGYTRIIKLGSRLGDNAPMAAIQLTEKIRGQEPAKAETKAKIAAPKSDKPKATTQTDTSKAPAPKKTATKSATVNRSATAPQRRGDK
jgi:large subunit ribosomal protein L17